MYGYEEYIDINPEQILQKIRREEIFEFVLEKPFSFSARYTSPFRKDEHPDCRFEQRPDGAILFVDFGEKLINPAKTHRSCFRMVMDKYNVTLNGAIRIICKEFGLSTSSQDYKPIERTVIDNKLTLDNPTNITYEKKHFTKSDIWYWSQFLIKSKELEEDNVFPTSRFSIQKDGKKRIINTYQYCYTIDFIDAVKIYQPYNTKYKWITNCDENHIGNFDNLPPTGNELIIKKSYKDHRVLRNLEEGFNVVWFQNEGCVPSSEILSNLISRFKILTFFYDNDEDGIKAAKKLVTVCNNIREGCAREKHLPKSHGHKDPAQYINREGRADLIKVLKKIGINGKNA